MPRISKKAWTKAPPKHAGKLKPKKEISKQGLGAKPDISTEKVNEKNTNNKFEEQIDHLVAMKNKKLEKKHCTIFVRLFTPDAASASQGAEVRPATVHNQHAAQQDVDA